MRRLQLDGISNYEVSHPLIKAINTASGLQSLSMSFRAVFPEFILEMFTFATIENIRELALHGLQIDETILLKLLLKSDQTLRSLHLSDIQLDFDEGSHHWQALLFSLSRFLPSLEDFSLSSFRQLNTVNSCREIGTFSEGKDRKNPRMLWGEISLVWQLRGRPKELVATGASYKGTAMDVALEKLAYALIFVPYKPASLW